MNLSLQFYIGILFSCHKCTCKFDITLIGFHAKRFECHQISTGAKYPYLQWYPNFGNMPKRRYCMKQSIGTDYGMQSIIEGVISNRTIQALINNSSLIVCIGISRLYSPVIKWKSNLQQQPLSTTITDSMPNCKGVQKSISILQIDKSTEYTCYADKSETCSIRNQCKYRFFHDPINEIEDPEKCHSNATFGLDANMRRMIADMKPEDFERLRYLQNPSCIGMNGSRISLPLCREDCYTLQFKYPHLWPLFSNQSGHRVSCKRMPSILDHTPCKQVSKTALDKRKLSSECYEKNDRHYIGYANRTRLGIPCQRWDTLCPHHHQYVPELYAELKKAENYCRNPTGLRPKPWCYTIDPNQEWDYCNGISLCNTEMVISKMPDQIAHSESIDPWLILSICGGLVFFITTISVYICKMKRDSEKRRQSMDSIRYATRRTDVFEIMEDAVVFEMSSLYDQNHQRMANIPTNELYFRNERGLDRRLEPLEVPRTAWTIIRELVGGEYSDVFLARIQANSTDFMHLSKRRMIVIKTLKEPCPQWRYEQFMHEACIAAVCQHHRVVRLLAVSFLTQPTCIIFEYIPLGDLKSLLESEGSQECKYAWDPPLRNPKRLLDIGYQISDGMVYLSNKRIVHRDLAARNVLVDEKLQMKISDFGLSKLLDKVGGQYLATDAEPLPVRWTAPEAWTQRYFSMKSDVWSYGILIWELLTLGMQPYFGMNHKEVVDMVVSRKETLRMPIDTHDQYERDKQLIANELMKPCFAYEPQDRPDFITLFSKAARLRASGNCSV